jgi:hypothetical protein
MRSKRRPAGRSTRSFEHGGRPTDPCGSAIATIRLGRLEQRTGDPPEGAFACAIPNDGVSWITTLEESERRLGKKVLVEGILERHEGRRLGTDDAASKLEEVMTEVHRRDRGDRATPAPGVLGGPVATAVAATSFVAKLILACPIVGVGGSPGPVIGRVCHRSVLRTAAVGRMGDLAGRPLGAVTEASQRSSFLPGRRGTAATSDGWGRPGDRRCQLRHAPPGAWRQSEASGKEPSNVPANERTAPGGRLGNRPSRSRRADPEGRSAGSSAVTGPEAADPVSRAAYRGPSGGIDA